MTEDPHGFSQAKSRLEEIVSQVRRKDTSLETSLDLLEEGVRLANRCTELIDQADWDAAADASEDGEGESGDESGAQGETDESAASGGEEPADVADTEDAD